MSDLDTYARLRTQLDDGIKRVDELLGLLEVRSNRCDHIARAAINEARTWLAAVKPKDPDAT